MRLTLVFLFCVSFAFSQTNDSQIAQQFYQNGEYEKAPGEDEMSMALGMTGWKGRVHLEFCNTIPWKEVEGERTDRVIAELVDKAISEGYKIWPNQVLAAEYLADKELISFSEDVAETVTSSGFKSAVEKSSEGVGPIANLCFETISNRTDTI